MNPPTDLCPVCHKLLTYHESALPYDIKFSCPNDDYYVYYDGVVDFNLSDNYYCVLDTVDNKTRLLDLNSHPVLDINYIIPIDWSDLNKVFLKLKSLIVFS